MAKECSELDFISKTPRSLEEESKASIVDFIKSKIALNGAFVGRADTGDIYYTYFGVASLIALGVDVPGAVKDFISGFGDGEQLDFVHLCCLARCRGILQVDVSSTGVILDGIEKYRSSDGGYSHTSSDADEGTAYAAYLASRAYDDCGVQIPGESEMLSSIKMSPDNVTTVLAAGMILLGKNMTEQIMKRHDADGGFKASEDAPASDLLSTAAALYALSKEGDSLLGIKYRCTEFVDMLWCDNGGFAGNLADLEGDVEYTYYGLLALGCLAGEG